MLHCPIQKCYYLSEMAILNTTLAQFLRHNNFSMYNFEIRLNMKYATFKKSSNKNKYNKNYRKITSRQNYNNKINNDDNNYNCINSISIINDRNNNCSQKAENILHKTYQAPKKTFENESQRKGHKILDWIQRPV